MSVGQIPQVLLPSQYFVLFLCRSSFAKVSNAIGKLFDRNDESMVKIHDGLVNATFFAVACYGIYRYGHKIAV